MERILQAAETADADCVSVESDPRYNPYNPANVKNRSGNEQVNNNVIELITNVFNWGTNFFLYLLKQSDLVPLLRGFVSLALKHHSLWISCAELGVTICNGSSRGQFCDHLMGHKIPLWIAYYPSLQMITTKFVIQSG